MGMAYNRGDLLGSMQTHVAATSAADKNSAGKATTAGAADASEDTPTGTPGGEGGGAGADQEDDSGGDGSGSQETDSDGTTAEDEGGTESEEQAPEGDDEADKDGEGEDPDADKEAKDKPGKWEEADRKWLEERGLKDMPADDNARKILKIAKDNHAAVQAAQQEVATARDQLAAVGNLLVSHDLESLNAMVQELGGEKLPFEVRDEQAQIKEITENYNAFYDTLESKLKDKPEVWAAVREALQPVQSKAQKAVDALERKMAVRQEVQEATGKAGKNGKAKYLEDLESKADKNFTELVKADANAKRHMEALKPLFKKGTVFQNFAKVYASDPQAINELGKALDFMKNFQKDYYPTIRQQIEKELKVKRGLKAPPSGKKGDGPGAGDPAPKKAAQSHNHRAGTRLLERFGRR